MLDKSSQQKSEKAPQEAQQSETHSFTLSGDT